MPLPSRPAFRAAARLPARALALLFAGLGLMVLAAVGFALWPGERAAAPQARSVIPQKVDFPAPELHLTTLDGAPVSLSALRGSVVLLNNWATWCPPCREEMPALAAYQQKHGGQNFTVIAVNAEEDADTVLEYLRKTGLQLPVWLDAKGSLFDVFGYDSLPTSFVVDPSGVVRLMWAGPISLPVLEEYVTPLHSP